MSQILTFDIKIPEEHGIKFEQESTFENFIGQFQLFCPKLLCIIDGTTLRYYDKAASIPDNIRFDYKQRRGILTEYYFRDISTDTLYCVFGREAAKIFYSRIDEVDPGGIITRPYIENKSTSVIKSQSFDAAKIQINNKIQSNTKNKPSIIEPIKNSNQISQIIPKTSIQPSNIIIIDKGAKLIFPNPNYPIEVKTLQSA